MIISNIIGGLGNQMFQYACGRALALDLQQPLRCSTDGFAGYKLHQGLALQQEFALELDSATPADLQRVLGTWRAHPQARRVLARWPLPVLTGPRFLAEPGGPIVDLRTLAGEHTYLHGYWQSERYFAHHTARLRTDFQWRRPLQGRNAETAQAIAAAAMPVSLHVRRGDYISNAKNQSIYASCSAGYYLTALQRLGALAGQPLSVFAFSDDPAWVLQALAPECPGLVVVDHNRGHDSAFDMQLMSLCRHHIIANSSFSWWGAWLNPSSDKQVIAPARWYADGRESRDLVPARWMRL